MYVIMSLDIMYICYLDMIFRRCIDCLHALCCSLVCTRPYYFIVFCCCCDGAYGCLFFFYFYFFLFKQKTASELRISDWSSDVCSSDLDQSRRLARIAHRLLCAGFADCAPLPALPAMTQATDAELILVLNCGSSSIKFALFAAGDAPPARTPAWSGKVEGIISATPVFSAVGVATTPLALEPERPYVAALTYLRPRILGRLDGRRIRPVSHHVVPSGRHYLH